MRLLTYAQTVGMVFAGWFVFFCVGSAHASLITDMICFDVIGFVPETPPATVPQNTVTGSVTITFDPAQTTSTPITPVDAINLTIAGHTYLASEVNFQYSPFQAALVIGTGNPNNVTAGENNFQLGLHPLFDFFDFVYTTSSINSTAFINSSTDATVTVSQVPEPASLTLLGAALVGLGATRRRKRKAA